MTMLKAQPHSLIGILLLFVLSGDSIHAEDAPQDRDELTRIATAHRLAAESQNVQQSSPALSLLLAVEALRVTMDHDELPVTTAHSALRSALMNTGGRSLGSHKSIVSMSSDSRWLVTDNQLWDLTTDNPTEAPFHLTGHTELLQCVMFHSDSRQLVTVSSDRMLLWDLTGSEPKASLPTGRGSEMWSGGTFSLDGRWLAASGYEETENDKDRFIRLWDFGSEQPGDSAVDLRGHQEPINIISFSPNGHWLATADENAVCLWDLQEEGSVRPAHVLTRHDEQLTSLLWSRDGRWMLTVNRKRSVIWDLTGNEPTALELNTQLYSDLQITLSQDSRWLLMVTKERRLRLWDLSSENPRSSMRELGDFPRSGYDAVWQPIISNDSRWVVATTATGNVIYLWDLKAAVPHETRHVLERSKRMIRDIVVDPQSRWIATAEVDGRVRIWNLRSPEPLSLVSVLPGHRRATKLNVNADGQRLISTGWDGTVRVWNMNLPNPTDPGAVLGRHEGTLKIAALSPDNRWLVTQSSDGARLWDLTAPDQTLSPSERSENGRISVFLRSR